MKYIVKYESVNNLKQILNSFIVKFKDFITPALHVKKDLLVQFFIVNENNKVGYLVEIVNQVYRFEEDEIEVISI